MKCLICFEAVDSEPFYAHPDEHHPYHLECIIAWVDSRETTEVLCPYCQLPVEDTKRIVNFPSALWQSNDPEDLKTALTNYNISTERKLKRLEDLAKEGLVEPFEVIWETLELETVRSMDYEEFALEALWADQIDFFKYLFETGHVQIFDVFYTFRDACRSGKTEFLRLLFQYGYHYSAGPRLLEDYKSQQPGLWIGKAVYYGYIDIFTFLCENGYATLLNEEEYSFNILADCFRQPSLPFVEVLLANGFYPCAHDCDDLLELASYRKFEAVKWFIEEAGCSHQHSWKKVKEIALQNGDQSIYQYICDKLGDDSTYPPLPSEVLDETMQRLNL